MGLILPHSLGGEHGPTHILILDFESRVRGYTSAVLSCLVRGGFVTVHLGEYGAFNRESTVFTESGLGVTVQKLAFGGG